LPLQEEGGADFLPDGGGGFVDGATGGNDFDAPGMSQGDGMVTRADALEEVAGLGFHAVEAVGGLGARLEAATGFFGVEIEDEGEVGKVGADGEGVDAVDDFDGEAAARTLVDGGGIEEAVGENPGASFEGGEDDLAHEFGAAGEEEEEFRLGGHAAAFGRVFEEVADRFAEGSAARFTGDNNHLSKCGEPLGKAFDLGRFARCFAAFEGDKAGGGGHGRKVGPAGKITYRKVWPRQAPGGAS